MSTLRRAFDHFVAQSRNSRRSPSWHYRLTVALGQWEKLTDNPDVETVTEGRLLEFHNAMLAAGFNPMTAECYPEPDVECLPEPVSLPIAWTREQLSILWNACANQTGEIVSIPAADWWVSLHCAIWDSGERIAAMLQNEVGQRGPGRRFSGRVGGTS